MGEMARRADAAMLAELAGEARYYSEAAVRNMFQLGRVLTEAKRAVPHGEWERWVMENASCSVRTAQNMMAAWARYGANEAVSALDRSKVFQLLALPEGAEDRFLAENDVNRMSAREIGRAVRAAKREAKAPEAQPAPEKQAEPEKPVEPEKPPEPPAPSARERDLERLLDVYVRGSQEQDATIAEMQETIDQMAARIAEMEMQAEHSGDEPYGVSGEMFRVCARKLMGSCAPLSHMQRWIKRMDADEAGAVVEAVEELEAFCEEARNALRICGFSTR